MDSLPFAGRMNPFRNWNWHFITASFIRKLCVKLLLFRHAMNVIVAVVNCVSVASLQHQLHDAPVEDAKDKQFDIILHTAVWWLSKGKVVAWFLSLFEEVDNFLKPENEDFNHLSDYCWLVDFVSVTDASDKLNSLNFKHQREDKFGWNDRLCKIIQSKTTLVDVRHEDEVSCRLPEYEESIRWWCFQPITICSRPSDTSGTVLKEIPAVHYHWGSLFCKSIYFSDATEIAACIARLIRVTVEELELETVDLKYDVMKSCATCQQLESFG